MEEDKVRMTPDDVQDCLEVMHPLYEALLRTVAESLPEEEPRGSEFKPIATGIMGAISKFTTAIIHSIYEESAWEGVLKSHITTLALGLRYLKGQEMVQQNEPPEA